MKIITTTSRSKKKPVKKKPKLHSRADAIKQIQLYSRLSRADSHGNVRCITCGKIMKWNEAQGGHFIANKNHYATAHLEDNIWPQCYVCNVCNHGEQLLYYKSLEKKFGKEFPDRLIDIDRAYHKDADALARLSREDRKLAVDFLGRPIKLSKYEWDELYHKYSSLNYQLKKELGE